MAILIGSVLSNPAHTVNECSVKRGAMTNLIFIPSADPSLLRQQIRDIPDSDVPGAYRAGDPG